MSISMTFQNSLPWVPDNFNMKYATEDQASALFVQKKPLKLNQRSTRFDVEH